MSATLQTPDWQHPIVTGRMDTSHLMTPPTSAPRVPKPGKEKRLKLRASCDACAASKIRCSKEHPICSRCSANKLQCVYGVSRKHGKPGRKRKRNPDGTPFVKATKNRSCPVNESGKYGYQFGPQLPQTDLEIASNWISDWSPTISLPDTSGFEFVVPSEQIYPDIDCFNANSADTVFMAMSQPEQEPVQAMESSFSYPEPLIENQTLQFDFLNTQNSDNYIGSDWGNLENYSADITIDTFDSFSSPSSLYSPMSQGIHNMRPMTSSTSITSPSRTCCHGLTCSTFGSTFPWGTSLSSPASDSFCSSSPSISGVISPLLAPGINQDTISNVYMQPSSFSSCEFNDGSQQMGSGISF